MKKIIENLIKETSKSFSHHILREFLQVHILYCISKFKYSKNLVFLGGTALKIFYGTSRYSEDLGFDLWNIKVKEFKFIQLLQYICSYFNKQNFKCKYTYNQKSIGFKSFIKFQDLLSIYGLSLNYKDVLSIKLEVDTQPNPNIKIQTGIINKYNLMFPIVRRDLSSLMAGKICAVFKRGYNLGRDFYDLVWYLSKKIEPNYTYLYDELKIKNKKELIQALLKLTKKMNIPKLISEVRPFLIKEEELFIYSQFNNLIKQYSFGVRP